MPRLRMILPYFYLEQHCVGGCVSLLRAGIWRSIASILVEFPGTPSLVSPDRGYPNARQAGRFALRHTRCSSEWMICMWMA